VTAAAVQEREHSPIDITSHDFWSQPFAVRDETFAQLRAGEGLTWHRPFPSMFPMEEPGYWALTRRADIAYVSQHPELFTSAQGVALDPMPAEIQHFASFFLTMDRPGREPRPARLADGGFREPNRPRRRRIRALVIARPAVRPLRYRGHGDQRAPGQRR
jgi:hypothetical protein